MRNILEAFSLQEWMHYFVESLAQEEFKLNLEMRMNSRIMVHIIEHFKDKKATSFSKNVKVHLEFVSL